MKKQLIILSALTMLTSPWALAQNNGEITVTPLPPATQKIQINISNEEEPPVSAVDIDALVEQALAESSPIIRVYDYIKHVDLRDVSEYDNEIAKKLPDSDDRLPGTSRKILSAVMADTERFIGTPGIKYFENGAKGPSGERRSVAHNGGTRSEFIISKRYPETYTNTLFSVDYISAVETQPKVIEAELLLFAQSTAKGPFFKKIKVVVDWNKNRTHSIEDVVVVTSSEDDILLTDTNFILKGSISDQKIILEDQNHGLTKVFPVTVGAIDARDNIVQSMNFHVPAKNRRAAQRAGKDPALQAEFQNFSNAALISRRVWNTGKTWANTSERTVPADYRGRPFMALVDMNYVDGNDFADGYREIGIHYQITRNKLERGFRSHGCVRVRDKDLYQVDAIVNQNTQKDRITAVFKNQLPGYESLNHPHTYNDNVAMVMYTDRNSSAYRNGTQSENILCKLVPDVKSRRVRWNNTGAKDYHTVIGNDCLTSTSKNTGVTSAEVKAYWNGNGSRIRPHIVNKEHGPIETAITELLQYNYHPDTVEAMSQRTRLETLAGLKNGSIINNNLRAEEPARVNWPGGGLNNSNIISAQRAQRTAERLRHYNSLSSRKRRQFERDNNGWQREVKQYYQRIYFKFCVEPSSPTEYENNCPAFQNRAFQ